MAITTVTVEKSTHAKLDDLKRKLSFKRKKNLSLDDVINELITKYVENGGDGK